MGDLTGDEDGAGAEADSGNPSDELTAIFDELLELAKQLDGAHSPILKRFSSILILHVLQEPP